MQTRWIAAKGREIRRNLSFPPWGISQNLFSRASYYAAGNRDCACESAKSLNPCMITELRPCEKTVHASSAWTTPVRADPLEGLTAGEGGGRSEYRIGPSSSRAAFGRSKCRSSRVR
jgi:hypothetical protein